MVIAGPGSGKTRIQAEKCRHLLRTQNEPIIAVTFTRDAAHELRSRILKDLRTTPKNLNVGTFHALAIEQLKRAGKMGRLLSTSEQMAVLRRAWMSLPCDMQWEDAIEAIEHHKSSLNPVIRDEPGGWLYRRYQELLQEHGSMDFADLLLNACRGMRDGTVSPLPARFCLIDEAQDIDETQLEWARHHAKAGAEITIVGDDDQSIYGWRRALGYQGMARFEKEFNAKRITLSTNYRCARSIVSASDRLIRNNAERMGKDARAHSDITGQVSYVYYDSRKAEADAIAATVASDPDGWAVFARTLRMLNVVESSLLQANIPYTLVASKRLWEKPHLGNMLAILRSLATGEPVGFEYLLVWAGVNEHDITQLRPLTVDKITEAKKFLPKDLRPTIDNLVERIKDWMDAVIQTPRVGLVLHGVGEWLAGVTKNALQAEDFLLAAETLAGYKGSMSARLNATHLQKKGGNRKGVTLSTLHGSKGLEYASVWLIGVEEKILPYDQSPVQEERRLAYVGMTRAKERLVLSTGMGKAAPSRFLVEAGLLAARGAS